MCPYPPPPPGVERLLRHPKFGSGIGFQRCQHLWEELRRPEWFRSLDALKVTGSKGKGSTATFAAEILLHLGLRTGLYTSPHLVRFNERIRIQGSEIDDASLANACAWYETASAAYQSRFPDDAFAAFEAFTAVGMHGFAHTNTEALVTEAGIGGRYDTTRSFPGQTVALTSVELEHADLLGKHPEFIAYDKADLCPENGSLVVGRIDPELVRRLQAYARTRRFRIVDVRTEAQVDQVRYGDWRMSFALRCGPTDFGNLETSLLGEHQAWNIAVAALAVQDWVGRNRPEIRSNDLRRAVQEAARTVCWPGRLQRLSTSPQIVVDVGHTPQSMRAIVSTLRSLPNALPVLLVTGVSHNKDVDGVLTELLPVANEVICTAAHYKGTPAEEIERRVRRLRPDLPTLAIPTIEDAVAQASKRAARSGLQVVIAGGLFLAVEAMAALQGHDPRSLRFA